VHQSLTCQQLVHDQQGRLVPCVLQMTKYSSAFASPSRVKLAHASGLDCTALTETQQRAAGKYGDIATLAAAHNLGMEYTAAIVAGAAQCNKLAEVQFLYSQGCPWCPYLLAEALQSGRYELVRWCHEHGCSSGGIDAACTAAESGNIELLAWVLQQPGVKLHMTVMSYAAYYGHLPLCKHLYELQCPWYPRLASDIAEHGNLELLRWLMANGCPWDAYELCMGAAYGGSIEVLAHLQQQGLLTEVLDHAAFSNKLDAAKWLREQGAEWPIESSWSSWSNEVLKWATAEGFIP
jgi:hypothetical protein